MYDSSPKRSFTPQERWLVGGAAVLFLGLFAAEVFSNYEPVKLSAPSFLQPTEHYAEMIGQTYDEQEEEWKPYDPADWWKR